VNPHEPPHHHAPDARAFRPLAQLDAGGARGALGVLGRADGVGAGGTGTGFSSFVIRTTAPTSGAARRYSGEFRVEYTSAGQPHELFVPQLGFVEERVREEVVFPIARQRDVQPILVVLDDSASMDETTALAELRSMVETLVGLDLDFRLGVVRGSGDGDTLPVGGTVSERITTPSSLPSPAEHFLANADVATTTEIQAPLDAALDGLFFRSNPGLLNIRDGIYIVVVTDGPVDSLDRAPSAYLDPTPLGSDPYLYGLVYGGESGCSGTGGSADGSSLLASMEASPNSALGFASSICESGWGEALAVRIRDNYGPRRFFDLDRTPVQGSLSIAYGTTPPTPVPSSNPNGERWRRSERLVEFGPAAPPLPIDEPGGDQLVLTCEPVCRPE